MLIQFKFGNYASFRDDSVLDMTKSRVTEYPHHVVDCGTDKVLKTTAVYGANASGKTNLYRALRCMRDYVLNSWGYGGNSGSLSTAGNMPLCMPFILDGASAVKDTMFEVWFYREEDKRSYNYGFSISRNYTVTDEWLNSKARTAREYKPVFSRSREGEITYSDGVLNDVQRNIIRTSLNKETLVISLGAKLKMPIFERVFQWFAGIQMLDFGTPAENFLMSRSMPVTFFTDINEQNDTARFLSTFDNSIKGFKVEKLDSNPANPGDSYHIFAKHKMNDTGDECLLPMEFESAGTQKMFTLYPPLKEVLMNGGVIFIDELSDRLHPLLQRNLILTFLNPELNPKNAQLIFTTHDVTLIATNLLRRDEIWIVEKQEDSSSQLYSVTDFKNAQNTTVHKNDSVWKRYLLGEYGGIPDLEKILIPGLEKGDGA